MQEFKLPDLGEGMQEAEIRRWLVVAGEAVKLDQPMVEVETDKAVVEIPAPIAGVIAHISVPVGAVAKLGEVLVTFTTTGNERVPATAPISPPISSVSTEAIRQDEPMLAHSSATNGATQRRRVLAAPAVRKYAFASGVDIEQVTPSHSNGRVTIEDVRAYSERVAKPTVASGETHSSAMHSVTQIEPREAVRQATPATGQEHGASEERKPLTGLRRRIAEHMEHSWRSIPHATSFDELDATELVALRTLLKPVAEQRGVRLTYMPLLLKLLLPALKEFPVFNASFDEEKREIVYKHAYHIGIATDSPEGLLVPVVRDADKLTMVQLAKQLEHLVAGAQKRSLTMQEVAGSTFTLNNVGSFGGSTGTPIINAPEVAILAVGRVQEKAIVLNGSVVIRAMMPLAMSFDHRVIDGAMAGRFLTRFKTLVEQPQQLLLDML